MDQGQNDSACAAYVYDEDVLDFLVKYDNNLGGVVAELQPDCVTIVNSQFLVAYRGAYDAQGQLLSRDVLFRIGYDRIPKCFGLMDTSAIQAIGAPQVQTTQGLSLKGEDVLIGFVDTGIDFAHPVFRRADGSSRVAAIWDQTEMSYQMMQENGRVNRAEEVNSESVARLQADSRPIFGYGREYTNEMLTYALQADQPYAIVPSRDENGHGTFLASVAAGALYEQEDTIFTGVAPEAEILMVKLKPAKRRLREFFLIPDDVPCYSEADIVLGIKYLINKAIELKKSLVICLGIGSSQGDHNGNLNLELYLDTIVTLPGVCVVGSAGNELGSGAHASSQNRTSYSEAGIISGQSRSSYSEAGIVSGQNRLERSEMEIYVEAENPGFCMEIWGRAPSLYQIVVVSPTGERFDRLPPNRDAAAMITYLYEGTVLYAENVVVENNSGDPFVLLRFERPAAGIWRIEVEESYNSYPVGYDAWLPIRQFVQDGTRFSRPDPEVILCAPANARGTITVAGYNHQNSSIYPASSRGYTRKGRIQPDFAAPAVDVFGAFAGGSGTLPLFARRSGTSVAAAFAAGAAALLLEWGIVQGNHYGLNTEVVRQMLIRGTRPVADITYPNPSWGWGVLDVGRAFGVLREGRV